MSGEQIVEVGGHRIKLTNLDKVLYPETGTTKAEVLDYYSRVAEFLIPHARDRAATRKRWVNGVEGAVFFEKQLPSHAPSWIKHRDIEHSDGPKTYPLVNDLPTLVWLAQMAALELHVPQWRFGRNGAKKNPDRLVLDLDPGEGAGLPECVEVAKLVRSILKGMGLDPMPVTSGSKGIHLYAALDGQQTSEEIAAVAHELARILEADHPDLVVSDMKKALRGGRVLLDWSQNNGAKTTIVPYSLRGRSRPTVAAPRTWKELDSPVLAQLEFDEVLRRITKGDPLADLAAGHIDEHLGTYRSMRDASKTPEPMGAKKGRGSGRKDRAPSFVIQEHHTPGRVHFDFRLEKDGVLVSWAVPKNVPIDPGQNHLAVHTEDHPLEYGSFEGTIPRGEYGAGSVEIWDAGTYEEEKFSDDEVIVILHGTRLEAKRVALIHTKDDQWLMHLMKDQRKGVWGSGGKPTPASKPLRKAGKTVVGSRTGGATQVHPMLATLGDIPSFTGSDDWAYEMKWDGYRAIATVRDGTVSYRSRNGLDFTSTYPELGELADAVADGSVLDGEIVALDPKGRPSFELLQGHKVPVRFFVFDALRLDGESVTALPYDERRDRLEAAVRESVVIKVPGDAGTDLTEALATSSTLGLEGVMAKRRDSPYREGKRSRDWIKLKHAHTQEVVVGGWRDGKGARADTVGSLLLGIPDGDVLRYVGRVGTGFSDSELTKLRARLDRLARQTSPLDDVPREDARDAHWVTPTLVGEVIYAEVTSDGRLRAPAWKGWRPDKSPDEVVREAP